MEKKILQHAATRAQLGYRPFAGKRMETRTGSVGDCTQLLAFRNPQAKFRRRSTRRRISNAQRLADFEAFMNKKVQASDGNFFERITVPVEVDTRPPDDELCTIKNLSINGDFSLMEPLYVEAMYTITHKVGKEECEPKENLMRYVQNAFQVDAETHRGLLERAEFEKPPVVLLNVLLLEAKDLIAKDVNGFSDPFTMMGVVPSRREKGLLSPDGDEENNGDEKPKSPTSKEKRDSVLHRFGGSFRRKINKKGGARGTIGSVNIPAKYIKVCSDY